MYNFESELFDDYNGESWQDDFEIIKQRKEMEEIEINNIIEENKN